MKKIYSGDQVKKEIFLFFSSLNKIVEVNISYLIPVDLPVDLW